MDHIERSLLLLLFCSLFHSALGDQLLFAIELSSPGFYYPKFPISVWAKDKPLLITNSGIRQQYLLGREIRKRYMEDMNFLADRYIYRNQFKVRTLASPEAISSVYSQLMGLYILGSGDLLSYTELQTSNPVNFFDYRYWTEELEMAALNHTYQTIPLIELAGISDYLLNTEEVCIGVRDIIESKGNSGKEKYRGLFNTIADAMGVNKNTVNTVSYAAELRYELLLSIVEGNPIKENAEEIYKNTADLEKAASYEYLLNLDSNGREVGKVITTPLLKEIYNELNMTATNHIEKKYNINSLHFSMYMARTHLLFGILQKFNITPDLTVSQTASVLLIELYKNDSSINGTFDDYYVKLIHDQSREDIPLTKMIEIIKNNTYDDAQYKEYCGRYEEKSENKFNWMILVYVFSGAIGLGLIILIICCIRRKCLRSNDDDDENSDDSKIIKALHEKLGIKDEP